MHGIPGIRLSKNKATRQWMIGGIIFNQFAVLNRNPDVVQTQPICYHFFVGMVCDADLVGDNRLTNHFNIHANPFEWCQSLPGRRFVPITPIEHLHRVDNS